MPAGPFLDTNILIYANSTDPGSAAAQALCEGPHTLSIQSLNEFANVARRKLQLDWDRIVCRLAMIAELADRIVPLTLGLHQTGIAIADRYRLQVYDAMILAAAFEARCDVVYSEDLQHGLVLEGQLQVINPFL